MLKQSNHNNDKKVIVKQGIVTSSFFFRQYYEYRSEHIGVLTATLLSCQKIRSLDREDIVFALQGLLVRSSGSQTLSLMVICLSSLIQKQYGIIDS